MTFAERAAATLDKSSVQQGDCRIWTGYTRGNGYGGVSIDGRDFYTHRLSFELAHGPIPDGLFVCHRCDTPKCIRQQYTCLTARRDQ
jgi:hypothetical protein